jgi:hypothetical protein
MSNVEIAFLPLVSSSALQGCQFPQPPVGTRVLSNVHLTSCVSYTVPLYKRGALHCDVDGSISRCHLRVTESQVMGIARVLGSLYWSEVFRFLMASFEGRALPCETLRPVPPLRTKQSDTDQAPSVEQQAVIQGDVLVQVR